jgi:hypothetical protein
MKVTITLVFTILIFCGCHTKKESPNTLPVDAEQSLRSAKELVLYSLDPCCIEDGNESEIPQLYGYQILGQTELNNESDLNQIVDDYLRGVSEHDEMGVAACFDPRHAIRVEHDAETHDFLICFYCSKTKWYIDGNFREIINHTDHAKSGLNQLLKEADIELAKLPGEK